jgi:hypothetical protein
MLDTHSILSDSLIQIGADWVKINQILKDSNIN